MESVWEGNSSPGQAEEAMPLATVVALTCNPPQYVLLALRQIALQDYPALEALVVHDGTAPLAPLLRAAYPALEIVTGAPELPPAAGGFVVRLLRLPHQASIGEKRALASRAARGDVVVHWDDDDFFEPGRISAQVAPIVRGAAEVTSVELSHMVAMPAMEVYAIPGQRLPLWSSLAYRASLGRELSFLNVSLAEDVDFAERAVQASTDPHPGHQPTPLPPLTRYWKRLSSPHSRAPLLHAFHPHVLPTAGLPPL